MQKEKLQMLLESEKSYALYYTNVKNLGIDLISHAE